MKKTLQSVLFILCCMGVGIGLGLLLPTMNYDFFPLIMGALMGFILGVAIHEAGHMIFGLLTGYQFVSYRFFDWIIYKQEGKLKLGKMTIAGTLGQCIMEPQAPKPFLLYHLGGVFMNFLFALILICLEDSFCIGMALMNVLMAVSNLIPMQGNDGANVLALIRNPKNQTYLYHQMKVVCLQSKNIALKEMPESLFMYEASDIDTTFGNVAAVLKENYALDCGDLAEAKQLALELYKHPKTHPIYRYLLSCDLIYFNLLNKQPELNEPYITKDFKHFLKQMKNEPVCLRTRFLLGELSFEEASKMAMHYPFKKDVEREIGIMESFNYGTNHCD